MIDDPKLTACQFKGQSSLTFAAREKFCRGMIALAVIALDYIAIVAAVCTAYLIRADVLPLYYGQFFVPEIYTYVVIPAAFMLFLHFDRLYFHKLYFWQQAEQLFKASVYAMLLVVVILYFSGSAKVISRIFVALVWVFSFSYLAIGRYFFKKFLSTFTLFQVPTLLIGGGKTAELLLEAFEKNHCSEYKIIGLIEDNPKESTIAQKYPVLGDFSQAEQVIRQSGIKNVLIAAPGLERQSLIKLVYRLQAHVNNITFVPDLFGVPVGSLEMETLFDEKAILLKVRNNLSVFKNRILKGFFERIFGTCLCVFMLPILAIIAIIIKIDSGGNPFFLGERLGRNGKPFVCYKFRTMHVDGDEILQAHFNENPAAKEEWESFAKLKGYDPRVTRIGKWLRKLSLDELPQILNVIKGDMSLVGPRPYLLSEEKKMGIYSNTILMTTPGITGLWQVSGRNEINFDGRLNLDCWYVRNWTLWLDIVILMKTIKVVLLRKGAY
jgi:undecaprenyl-phosphate galactose phosphotransferase